MTEEKTHKALSVLQAIANGRATRNIPIRREEMVTLAREACDAVGLPYDRRSIDSLEIGK